MPEAPPRRAVDPPDVDYSHARDGADELRFGIGRWYVGAKGPLTILVIMLLALGGGLIWTSYLNLRAHRETQFAVHTQTCVLSIPQEQREQAFSGGQGRNFIEWLRFRCPYLRPAED